MNKRWARIFLAAMTVLCLWGAWMTPFYFPLPKEDVQFFDFNVEYVDYTGWYECSLKNTPQADALTKLLRETELRRISRRTAFGGLFDTDDYYYNIDFVVENRDWHGMHFCIYIGRRNGRSYGEGQFINARIDQTFRVPDPNLLLDFLEQFPFEKEEPI